MKHIVSFLIFLVMASSAFAQNGMPPVGMPPGAHPGHPSMETTSPVLNASYPDSTAFNVAFKELYPLIKPTPNIKERAGTMMSHMGPGFHARGVDSAKAYDSVMKNIDPDMDEKILFKAYRAEFKADELKPLIAFLKTPSGKHFLEVESKLYVARTMEIDQYVRVAVQKIIAPMGKTVETPPSYKGNAPGMARPGMPPPNQPPPPPAPSKN
jgi:hypothetical protein